MEHEIYQINEAQWGFKIGGVVQEWTPDVDGYVPMSLEDATYWYNIFAVRLGYLTGA